MNIKVLLLLSTALISSCANLQKLPDLHSAIMTGEKEEAFSLAYKSNVNEKDVSGETPLHHAASVDDYETAKILIERGAFLNVASNTGYTPLMKASFAGSYNVAKLLIASNADVFVRNKELQTSLHIASAKCNLDIVVLLLESNSDSMSTTIKDRTPLHWAAENNCEEVASVLVDHDVKPLAMVDSENLTPYGTAAYSDSIETARVLLSKGARPKVVNPSDSYDKFDVATTLLKSGASYKIAAEYHETYGLDNTIEYYKEAAYYLNRASKAIDEINNDIGNNNRTALLVGFASTLLASSAGYQTIGGPDYFKMVKNQGELEQFSKKIKSMASECQAKIEVLE